jgi:hypothetical protein
MLSTPKCGSTAIEDALSRHAYVILRGKPSFKHVSAADFETHLAPLLDALGCPRSTYEVVCLFRDPADWLMSWWRYRARPGILKRPKLAPHYTGNLAFEDFARNYINGPVHGVSNQNRMVLGSDGAVSVDRIFRYEDRAAWQAWLSGRVPNFRLAPTNVSPERVGDLSPQTRLDLRDRMRLDYSIYDRLGDPRWSPKGYVPAGLG